MHMLLLNRHMRIWPTPCGGIEKEKAKSDLSNKIPLLASFERSFYGLFLTKAALLPFLLTPASKQAASLLIKLAELHIYEEARKGPTLLLSSASAYEEGSSIHNDIRTHFLPTQPMTTTRESTSHFSPRFPLGVPELHKYYVVTYLNDSQK